MDKFRGWHILAGIAAMVLTGILGTVMGLNNTAAFMSSCVAFVAVALWTESRLSRRKRDAAGNPGGDRGLEPGREPDRAPDRALRDEQQ